MRLAARIAPFMLLLAAGCASGPRSSASRSPASRSPVAPFQASVADSIRTQTIAPGVRLHQLVQVHAPWRAAVLDIDLTACVSLRAVKGSAAAVGRRTTSALLASLPAADKPLAAVNADFFLFAPPGVPVGAHIENGRLISGPVDRAVFGITTERAPWIGRVAVSATVRSARDSVVLSSWNRPERGTPGIVDASWGVALDSTITGVVWRLRAVPAVAGATALPPVRYVLDTLADTDSRIARADTLLAFGMVATSSASRVFRIGDTVTVSRAMRAPVLEQAVGGMPALMRDSMVLGTVDSVSNAGFRGLNPRTAVGIANRGARVFLVVIDGRQAGYSIGMTLRETSTLLRDMGAHDAINLDGGGSSALVVNDPSGPDAMRVVNKPSDAIGERPVANALAVVGTCGRR